MAKLFIILVAVVAGFGIGIFSAPKTPMAQSDIDRLAAQLQNRLRLSFKNTCTSDYREPYCKEFLEAYANLIMMIARAKDDDTGASLMILKRDFDKRPDIIHSTIP